MVNTNISKSEKIVANTRVEKIVSKFGPPWTQIKNRAEGTEGK